MDAGARLTAEGERLIEFARRIIQVEAGALAALSRKGLRGAVRLGIPDDYAESFLAEILARFNRRHPLVEVSVVCEASIELAAQVAAGALELALVTAGALEPAKLAGFRGFELLREEPLVWAAAERFRTEEGAPIPLALGSGTCVWRRAAEDALAASSRATRGLFFSKNFTAIGSIVRAGLAATILPASMVGPGLRRPGARRGPARIAPDPHGPHPCARTSDRGSEARLPRRSAGPSARRRVRPLERSAADVFAEVRSGSPSVMTMR